MYRRRHCGTPFSMIDEALPSPGALSIGTARFRFSDGANGEFSYTIGAVSQTRPIIRLQVGALATACETTPVQ